MRKRTNLISLALPGTLVILMLTFLMVAPARDAEAAKSVWKPDGQSTSPLKGLASLPQSQPGTFTPTGSMNIARSDHTSTLMRNGRVLVTGGNTGTEGTNTAEIYDPSTGSWRMTGEAMKLSRMNHTATLLKNGRVLIVGGTDGITGHALAEIYDPSTDSFSLVANMSVQRSVHTATLLNDGRVLVTGGHDSAGNWHSSAEVYSPSTDSWSALISMNSVRIDHMASPLPDGRVLISGGIASPSASTALSSAELFDPSTNSFTPTGNMTTGRRFHTATTLSDGRVLIAGGETQIAPGPSLSSAEVYDVSTGSFQTVGSMTSGRRWHVAALLETGEVLVAGGHTSGVDLNSAELYNPVSETFTSTGNMADPRRHPTATPLLNGRVLVAGGSSGFTVNTSADLYDAGLCTLEMDVNYVQGTLTMNFDLGTPEPALWKEWLVVPSIGVIPLWSIPLPVIEPPVSFDFSIPFPSIGIVGFLTTLSTTDGIICADWDVVNTGPTSQSGLSQEKLRNLIPRPNNLLPSN